MAIPSHRSSGEREQTIEVLGCSGLALPETSCHG